MSRAVTFRDSVARVGALFICGVLTAAGTTVGTAGDASAETFPVRAIGRLIVDRTRVCTAFVLRSVEQRSDGRFGEPTVMYENWLVSAGHCHAPHLLFRQRDAAHPIVRVLGYSAGGTRGHDVMVAVFMTHLPVPTLEPAFGEYPRVGDQLMLIGFGRNALMMRVGRLVGYEDRGHMQIEGYASPGNSGGPVLIPGTRRVVGIGIETSLDRPAGTPPLHCGFGGCAVRSPYTATHIDRIKGVANLTSARR